MEYEWDPDKAESNLSKHGMDFSDAVEALDDPHRLEDPDPYEDEERTRVLCLYEPWMAVLFVVTAEPEEGLCRIISAPVGPNHMSKNATGKIVRYSRDNLPPSRTDWAKVMAMTDEEIRARALADPDAQPMTAEELARMRPALPQAKKKRRAR
jgi:uncharacterized protein